MFLMTYLGEYDSGIHAENYLFRAETAALAFMRADFEEARNERFKAGDPFPEATPEEDSGNYTDISESEITVYMEGDIYRWYVREINFEDAPGIESYLEKPLDELDLTAHAYNMLRRANITTIGKLSQRTVEDLGRIYGMDMNTLEQIVKAMDRFGLPLKAKPDARL